MNPAAANPSPPHFLLFSDRGDPSQPGRWGFLLRAADGSARLEADDREPDVRGERLELLTIVRGLEALEQPSRVTLITPSGYVREGIRNGLAEWRKNGWLWERFGQMVPVKNADLWQRVDRAMQYHRVECRSYRFDPPHLAGAGQGQQDPAPEGDTPGANPSPRRLQFRLDGFAHSLRNWIAGRLQEAGRRVAAL